MPYKPGVINLISWLFGLVVIVAGIVNLFWGNDPGFGIFLLILSLTYFLPVDYLLKKITGVSIPRWGTVKIVLGILIIWASLGVGELLDKIDMMLTGSGK